MSKKQVNIINKNVKINAGKVKKTSHVAVGKNIKIVVVEISKIGN